MGAGRHCRAPGPLTPILPPLVGPPTVPEGSHFPQPSSALNCPWPSSRQPRPRETQPFCPGIPELRPLELDQDGGHSWGWMPGDKGQLAAAHALCRHAGPGPRASGTSVAGGALKGDWCVRATSSPSADRWAPAPSVRLLCPLTACGALAAVAELLHGQGGSVLAVGHAAGWPSRGCHRQAPARPLHPPPPCGDRWELLLHRGFHSSSNTPGRVRPAGR